MKRSLIKVNLFTLSILPLMTIFNKNFVIITLSKGILVCCYKPTFDIIQTSQNFRILNSFKSHTIQTARYYDHCFKSIPFIRYKNFLTDIFYSRQRDPRWITLWRINKPNCFFQKTRTRIIIIFFILFIKNHKTIKKRLYT